jgi:hypothetical protein
MNRSGKAIMKIKLSFLLVLPSILWPATAPIDGFRTYERAASARGDADEPNVNILWTKFFRLFSETNGWSW